MGKIRGFAGLMLGVTLAVGGTTQPGESVYDGCLQCHAKTAPPLSLVYRRYLMLYSSKGRILRRMVTFLRAPSKAASSMPEGMKNRFNPQFHPAYDAADARRAVKRLIEEEDLIRRFKPPQTSAHRR